MHRPLQALYSHPAAHDPRAQDGLIVDAASRTTVQQLLGVMLATTNGDPGFVAAAHTFCMRMSLANYHASVSEEGLPAFPVAPRLLGESAMRYGVATLACRVRLYFQAACVHGGVALAVLRCCCDVRSLNYTTGIRALEEALLAARASADRAQMDSTLVDGAAPSRGAKSRPSEGSKAHGGALKRVSQHSADSRPADITSAWGELAKLYNAVGDEEVRRCCGVPCSRERRR